MLGGLTSVAVVTPVYGNEATLVELALRIDAALAGRPWRLRLVVDASPDGSLAVAERLAEADDRIAVTALTDNVGQNRALRGGLREENGAGAWVCLDADLQDPPEAIPALLERLADGDVGAVFGGRRGRYESPARRLSGRLHRAVMTRLTGLPRDAGAFVALGPAAREAVVRLDGPSLVAAVGLSGVRTVSVPVERAARADRRRSAWTAAARLCQAARTMAWVAAVLRHRRDASKRPTAG
ncbi:MAG: glycosyltransferase [Acidimicrobiales bacterium]